MRFLLRLVVVVFKDTQSFRFFQIVLLNNSTIWLIDEALKGSTTQGQGGPESNYNKGLSFISITPEL